MKIRNGFVSNSSSSSFILAIKLKGTLSKNGLLDLLQIPRDAPGARFIDCILRAILCGDEYVHEEDGQVTAERIKWTKQRDEFQRRTITSRC